MKRTHIPMRSEQRTSRELPRSARSGTSSALCTILARLDRAYDYSAWHWQPDTPSDYVCISAVLVQHTNWNNVERALERLAAAGALSLESIASLSEAQLAALVRPAGTPLVKATRLLALARLARDHGGLECLLALPAAELRTLLLATHGIGPETADAVLLYAAGRPTFVIDAYTVRIMRRLGLGPERNGYDAWQRWFESHLANALAPRTVIPSPAGRGERQLAWDEAQRGRSGGRGTSPPPMSATLGEGPLARYRRAHALLVLHGKQTCRPKPRCGECCLLDLCDTGANIMATTHEGGAV